MISSLCGEIRPGVSGARDVVTVVCGGVGYELIVGPAESLTVTVAAMRGASQVGAFAVHSHWLQDSMPKMYGFRTVERLKWFRRIINVDGVGPSTAMATMEAMSEEEFDAAIARGGGDLTKIKGIGPKLVARIVADLGVGGKK